MLQTSIVINGSSVVDPARIELATSAMRMRRSTK